MRIRARVEQVRERQRQRFAGTKLACNADMGLAEMWQFYAVDEARKSLP